MECEVYGPTQNYLQSAWPFHNMHKYDTRHMLQCIHLVIIYGDTIEGRKANYFTITSDMKSTAINVYQSLSKTFSLTSYLLCCIHTESH